jgi:hypothetical protein
LEPENSNYIFHGVGTSLTDGSFGKYGGVVYAYNQTHTLLWIPSYSSQSHNIASTGGSSVSTDSSQQGYMVYVGDVWINNENQKVVSSRAKICTNTIKLSGM